MDTENLLKKFEEHCLEGNSPVSFAAKLPRKIVDYDNLSKTNERFREIAKQYNTTCSATFISHACNKAVS